MFYLLVFLKILLALRCNASLYKNSALYLMSQLQLNQNFRALYLMYQLQLNQNFSNFPFQKKEVIFRIIPFYTSKDNVYFKEKQDNDWKFASQWHGIQGPIWYLFCSTQHVNNATHVLPLGVRLLNDVLLILLLLSLALKKTKYPWLVTLQKQINFFFCPLKNECIFVSKSRTWHLASNAWLTII